MLNSHSLKTKVLASAFVLGLATSGSAMAAEHGSLNYPAGSPGTFIGKFPPAPGLFMVSQTSFTTADAMHDADGDEIQEDDFQLDVWVQTLRILPSYPWKLAGANLYSQLVVPIVMNIDASLSVDTPVGSLEIFDDDDAGLGNITVTPLLLHWQQKESHQYFTLGVDYVFAQGASYDHKKAVNAGTGYASIIPVAAYRYDRPNGLDFGVKPNYIMNLENDDIGHDSGDMIAIESLIGWNFGKWKVALLANYTDQIEEDTIAGVEQEDSEYRYMNIGPSVTFSNGPMIINVNAQVGVLAENTSMNNSFWFNFTLPLYVPKPPMPKS